MTPLPARPTIAHAIRAIEELHNCHESEAALNKTFRQDTQINFDRLNVVFGIDKTETPKVRPKITIPRLFFTITASITAVGAIYKFSMAIAPDVWHAILHLAAAYR